MTKLERYPVIEVAGMENNKNFKSSRDNLLAHGIQINKILPMIKENYNLSGENFDDEFVNFLKTYQEGKNLNSDGILGMQTLVRLNSDIPNMFDRDTKNKISMYEEGIKGAKVEIKSETTEKISELSLVSKNIKPKDEAFAVVRDAFGLKGTPEEMRVQMIELKTTENIKSKTKNEIDENTVVEAQLKVRFTLDELRKIEEKGFSKEQQDFILNYFKTNGFSSKAGMALAVFIDKNLEENKNDPKFEERYGAFQKAYGELRTGYISSPEGKKELAAVQNDPNYKTFLGEIIDVAEGKMEVGEFLKNTATNPKLWLVAGVTFLFGLWGSGSSWTDAWYKRLGLIILGGTFGPSLVSGKDFERMINRGGEIFNEGTKSAKKTETYNAVTKTFPKWAEKKFNEFKAWTGIAGDEIGKYSDKSLENMKIVFGNIERKNTTFENSKNPKEREKYVSELSFFQNELLVEGSDFSEVEITKLKEAKGDAKKIISLLGAEKNKIFSLNLDARKTKQREKDLVNFVNLLLDEATSETVYVGEILIGNDILKSITEKTMDKLVSFDFLDDKEINENFRGVFLTLPLEKQREFLGKRIISSNAGKLKNILGDLVRDEKNLEVKEIFSKLEALALMQYELEKFKNTQAINKENIEKFKKLKIYDKLKVIGLEDLFIRKIDEIYYESVIKSLKGKELLSEDERLALEIAEDNKKAIELGEKLVLPTASLKEYYNFITKEGVSAGFIDAMSLLKKYKGKNELISNKVNKIIVDLEVFEKNSKELEKIEVSNIEKLISEIKSIDINQFKEKQGDYEKNLKDILDRVYPNEFPTVSFDLSFLSKLKDYAFSENKKDIYRQIFEKINNISGTSLKSEVYPKLKELESSLYDKVGELKKVEQEKRKKERLVDNEKIFEAYKKFYDKANGDADLPDPEEQVNDMTLEPFFNFMEKRVYPKIEKSTNISNFRSEYEELAKTLEEYLNLN